MALQIDLESPEYGTTFTAAYYRITDAMMVRRSPQVYKIYITVIGFAVQPDIYSDLRPIDSRRYDVPFEEIDAQEGDTLIAKCYQWVMAQPDMLGSIAV